MIHPEFFTSATLARLDPRTLVTFAGLWIYCDDFGRGEDDASFVAAAVWPRRHDIGAAEVEADLTELAAVGVLCRYRVGTDMGTDLWTTPLFHLPSWFEHQKVSHPTPSKLPPCHSCEGTLFREWYRGNDTATERFRRAEKAARAAKTGRGNFANGSGTAPERLPNDSAQCSSVQFSSVQGTVHALRRRTAG